MWNYVISKIAPETMKVFRAVTTLTVMIAAIARLNAASAITPTAKEIATMGDSERFSNKKITATSSSTEAPHFKMVVEFESPDSVKIDRTKGAIAAKVELAGVPQHYHLPDGWYYLWFGLQNEQLTAELISLDGTHGERLCTETRRASTSGEGVLATDRGSPCGMAVAALTAGPVLPRPQPGPPQPRPPQPAPQPPQPAPRRHTPTPKPVIDHGGKPPPKVPTTRPVTKKYCYWVDHANRRIVCYMGYARVPDN